MQIPNEAVRPIDPFFAAIDVRGLPDDRGIPMVAYSLALLRPGQSLRVTADGDPLRLREALAPLRSGRLEWSGETFAPDGWRAVITRNPGPQAADPQACEAEAGAVLQA